MIKELEPLKALENIRTICYQDVYERMMSNWDTDKYFKIVKKALKRNIELEEENEILKIIRDNFDLWIEPNYRATLQFQQNASLTQSDYKKLIKYFGEPRDD